MDTDDVEQAASCELALLSASVRRSRGRVEELLDLDFREIGASGRLWTRAEMVDALVGEGLDGEEADPIEAEALEGRVVGPGLVLLTYISDQRGRRARRSSLWRRSQGAWRLVHHQGTPIGSS